MLFGRLHVGTKLTVLVIVPVCCLLLFAVAGGISDWRSANRLRDFRAASRLSFITARVVRDLESERLAAVANRIARGSEYQTQLQQAESETTHDLVRATAAAEATSATPIDVAGRLDAVRRQRQGLLFSTASLGPEQISGAYSIIVHNLLDTVGALNVGAPTNATEHAAAAYIAIVQAIAAASRERTEIALLLAPDRGRTHPAAPPWAMLEAAQLGTFRQEATGPLAADLEAVLFSPAGTAVQRLRDGLTANPVEAVRRTSLADWLSVSNARIAGLRAVAGGAATSLDAAATRDLDGADARAMRDLALSLAVLITVTALGLLLRRSITGPLREVSEGARRLSSGDLASGVTYTGRDEIGDVAAAFRELHDTASRLADEIRANNAAVRENRLDRRSDQGEFGGTWGQLVDGMNDTMAAFTELQGQRERAEREAGRIFDLSLEMLSISSMVDGHFKRVNPAFERTLGYPPQVLMSRPFMDFIHPDDRERTRKRMSELARGQEVVRFENRYIRSDGSVCWLQWSSRPVPEEGLVYGSARDVTASHRQSAQQAGVQRLATLIAREAEPAAMFEAVCEEAICALDADFAKLLRYEAGTAAGVIVAHAGSLHGDRALGARVSSADDTEAKTTLNAPVVVDGRLWGTMSVTWRMVLMSTAEGARKQLSQFADLLGIGLANTRARTELAASRARVVEAADDARRRIERDLHDGVQQRLISLALEARHAEEMAEEQSSAELREKLRQISEHIGSTFDELREIALGIHPAILAHGGLAPAVRTIARRSPVPVSTDLPVRMSLPERVQVAAYYVVSEALTNTAKHAHASTADVTAAFSNGHLELTIRDDGIGGAVLDRGSGLIGLTDRVEALGGTLDLMSPPGHGTTLVVHLPITEHSC